VAVAQPRTQPGEVRGAVPDRVQADNRRALALVVVGDRDAVDGDGPGAGRADGMPARNDVGIGHAEPPW
jgi:hypothetical protein